MPERPVLPAVVGLGEVLPGVRLAGPVLDGGLESEELAEWLCGLLGADEW